MTEKALIELTKLVAEKLKENYFQIKKKTDFTTEYEKIELSKQAFYDRVIDVTSAYFGVPKDALLARDRARIYSIDHESSMPEIRFIAMALCREMYKGVSSLKSIGIAVGGRDHASVLYGIRKFNDLCATDKNYQKYYEDIKILIKKSITKP